MGFQAPQGVQAGASGLVASKAASPDGLGLPSCGCLTLDVILQPLALF